MSSLSNSSNDFERNRQERGEWSKKVEYVLSMVGYLVGLGNLWRFPYICMRNGGGAFLIPFLFFLVLCGLPLLFLETTIGQFSGKGFLHVWEVCPLFKGIGVGMMIPIFVFSIYYNMIIAWTLYYIGNSFLNPLPWTTCDNYWNSPNCVVDHGFLKNIDNITGQSLNISSHVNEDTTDMEFVANRSSEWITAQEDFWQNNVLQMSTGLEDLGNLNWRLLLCLLGAWVIVGLCIIKGIKSIGKVVYVTAVLPYILLTVIFIRGLTLEGSLYGVMTFLNPDFSKLLEISIWIEAGLQVFFSLGTGTGLLISLASFNKFDNNCLRDSVLLSFTSEGTSIYCGLVIFTVLGFMATKFGLPIDKIVKSGPGIGFMAYPEALAHLPGQNVWSCLFFIMLLTVGLDSQFAICESAVGVLTDSFPRLRRRRSAITVMFCLLCFVLGIIFCFQVLVISTFAGYKRPAYGRYVYPQYSAVIGILISVSPIIPIIVFAIIAIRKAEGITFFSHRI
ncbi:Sodium- and chloride-dependent GABA transporter 2,Sodium- and chloride-dependent taurine transporter,Sodium-dependent dopamine transporter,Sodium-dependent proline transporter,Sodium-and chloride-dependent glycine transporter 2,Sodium-dependent noradrenaline transporter,Sodium- and chloride-dependent GABA transporter 1,Sodium- and chloride-dependent betaine transporter,Sodium- and chloride-dependent neutral and basic amino acid transporter B(0+),Creatine transporter,Sodium-dependent neutral amino acid tran|uniref:Transporter n=1 Tax=Mytilus edulis TaxID=6550 RepID=A0A8S3PVE7_MYTED|nr:Sodium- and chloride-dependent GABA transporter 2,Sodium- and chloride-dependent taurine transporter,Sodium-dependent dopamine transporter,Sodium-dependent proline transporter,Sodium-and chloride-dependent glycine transporter 2,Sodium-dependent noradrenaline transporter,Sodium- and chloride-dependent GABA transporter 1,Sodium- and chloride-dependent betaine transporter,Sodium- and chloride-dependent neutral and basic amino acid transporter B(0+),Creatine transporter,Sodium-dependent neutral amin